MSDDEQVFGEPLKQGRYLIIPTAEVVSTFGFDAQESGAQPGLLNPTTRERRFTRPVAVIVASADGVSVEAVKDLSKITMAAVTVGIFLLGFFIRLLNPSDTLKKLSQGKWD